MAVEPPGPPREPAGVSEGHVGFGLLTGVGNAGLDEVGGVGLDGNVAVFVVAPRLHGGLHHDVVVATATGHKAGAARVGVILDLGADLVEEVQGKEGPEILMGAFSEPSDLIKRQ